MREAIVGHIYVNRWAVCAMGKIGKIDYVYTDDRNKGIMCEGVGLDGKKWKGHNPRLLHKSYDNIFDGLRARTVP